MFVVRERKSITLNSLITFFPSSFPYHPYPRHFRDSIFSDFPRRPHTGNSAIQADANMQLGMLDDFARLAAREEAGPVGPTTTARWDGASPPSCPRTLPRVCLGHAPCTQRRAKAASCSVTALPDPAAQSPCEIHEPGSTPHTEHEQEELSKLHSHVLHSLQIEYSEVKARAPRLIFFPQDDLT